MARYFIITGEPSGDRLGAMIGGEILRRGHQVSGWGGKYMEKVNIPLTQDIAELKIMGWTDVILSLPKYYKLLSQCKQDIISYNPDKVVLIDFGSFNLRIAQWAKKQNFKVTYYSPPKIWASRPNRLLKLKKYCDQVIVLFPFEKTYYESRGLPVGYFGHPIANEIKSFAADPDFRIKQGLDKRPILSILPGSRPAEIKNTLPIYLKAIEGKEYQICVSVAPGQESLVQNICESATHVNMIVDLHYNLLSNSDLAIVTSGTATLEAALFNVPQIVGYKTSNLNYFIARQIITTKYISLVNLLADEPVVTELIQKSLNTSNITNALDSIKSSDSQLRIFDSYRKLFSNIFDQESIQKSVEYICS